jgi:hypothetical protein
MMPVDVFLSRPTAIEKRFETAYAAFESYLSRAGYKTHRLGADQYTMDAPLTGVMKLMETCKAAIILGYPQYEVTASLSKAAKPQQRISVVFPTPWNQIEATLAFKQRMPVLVVAHEGVSGGIFDYGVTGEYVHTTKLNRKDWYKEKGFQCVLREWKKRIK